MPLTAKSESVPAAMKESYEAIITMTNAFCTEHLNEEYAQICRWMAATLARKRPSPLLGGKTPTWAAGIIHAVGTVNFAFDKSQTPYITVDGLASYFGLSKSTVGNKSKSIRDTLNVGLMDPDWTIPSRMNGNPMAWMISVDGFIIDARSAPRHIQEAAFAKGLIPYLPEPRNR